MNLSCSRSSTRACSQLGRSSLGPVLRDALLQRLCGVSGLGSANALAAVLVRGAPDTPDTQTNSQASHSASWAAAHPSRHPSVSVRHYATHDRDTPHIADGEIQKRRATYTKKVIRPSEKSARETCNPAPWFSAGRRWASSSAGRCTGGSAGFQARRRVTRLRTCITAVVTKCSGRATMQAGHRAWPWI